jgi:hypothetical protein
MNTNIIFFGAVDCDRLVEDVGSSVDLVFVSTVVRCEGNVDDCLVVESVTMECVVDGNYTFTYFQ